MHDFDDIDYAKYLDQIIYTSEYVFNLFRGAIGYMSKRWAIVALSTIEVENMVTTRESKEEVWLHQLCSSMVWYTGLWG